ncbi:putative T6SS immunity periplasmic lipoprotein [Pantoea sp. FN0307]|uniref:putative T6SS immunity periplasmic lipoprotein n=1 Tax=unclassified Pantoea TaxID=2630326 RepID=UPI003CFBA91C
MNKPLVITAALLLTGSPGQGGRAAPRVSTTAAIKDNYVYIASKMNAGEKTTAIQIYSDTGDKFIKQFDNEPIYTAKGGCLPVFNYIFNPGKHYLLAYDIATPHYDNYLITTNFIR